MKRAHILHGFRHVKPKFQTPQAESADWLAEAHTVAEEVLAEGSTAFDRVRFFDRLSRVLNRLGAGRDPILTRGHECSDFRHRDWSSMRLFNLRAGPRGAGFEERNRFFVEAAADIFDQLYPPEIEIPDDLIHVTCTGYASPSPAQLLVSGRRVRKPVNVVHAYHMGCYAAFPAIALAVGLRSASELRSKSGDGPRKTEVVHTEMCSIHLDPSSHSMEQLVVQTLFADGFIKYSVGELGETDLSDGGGFEILAIREELIPESATAMTWVPTDWGLHMTLTAEVPALISASLAAFLESLSRQIDADFADLKKRALFAVHPGGPKILSAVQETLGLGDEQLRASREVLSECGNMSSATVPHVWERISNDAKVDSGTLVFSLAFGPGLTVCGNLLGKL